MAQIERLVYKTLVELRRVEFTFNGNILESAYPLSQTPTWVHFDRRYGTPACSGTTAGYPTLRRGSRGCYVMILQDALSTLGYQTGSRIDGLFGTRTEEALRGYQRRTSLTVDGVCGCNSWKKITTAVLGIGRTKTTID